MCTVFAESEAVSLIHRGVPRADIALDLHTSVIEETYGMVQRVGFSSPLVFTGGRPKNRCIVALLAEKLSINVPVPPQPQLAGALSEALSVLLPPNWTKKNRPRASLCKQRNVHPRNSLPE